MYYFYLWLLIILCLDSQNENKTKWNYFSRTPGKFAVNDEISYLLSLAEEKAIILDVRLPCFPLCVLLLLPKHFVNETGNKWAARSWYWNCRRRAIRIFKVGALPTANLLDTGRRLIFVLQVSLHSMKMTILILIVFSLYIIRLFNKQPNTFCI